MARDLRRALAAGRGLFAVRQLEIARYEGGTHPWDPGVETWLAFDTRTGATIAKKDLLPTTKPAAAALGKLLDRCLVAYVRDAASGEAAALADMRERVSLGNLALLVLPTDGGLHFAATGYAPPARVLEGEGPTITWAALLGARRSLREGDPAHHYAWEACASRCGSSSTGSRPIWLVQPGAFALRTRVRKRRVTTRPGAPPAPPARPDPARFRALASEHGSC